MKDKITSPAIKLVQHVWSNSLGATGHSWERLNRSMRASVNLAIDAGLRFDVGDFQHFYDHFRIWYWGGHNGHMLGECFYSLAVRTANWTAAMSFEAWKGRTPIIVDTDNHHDNGRRRTAVGMQFRWHGEMVKVTSFASDESHLIACSYKRVPYTVCGREYLHSKLVHRYRISRDDVIADRKARKAFMATQAVIE